MKNVVIGILVVVILGLGGWTVFDKNHNTPAPSSSGTPGTEKELTSQTGGDKTLDLSRKGISEVGPSIYDKTGTVTLILSYNNLKSLKSEMGRMTSLQTLKLDHNLLEGSLIGEIRKMPLQTLDVSHNNMTGMPAEIGQLNQLQTLDYSYNKLTGLPNELANLKDNLKEFNLTGNPLSQDTISKLRASLPNTTIIF